MITPRKPPVISKVSNFILVVYLAVLSSSCSRFGARTGHMQRDYAASNWDEMEDALHGLFTQRLC